jgi:hypothetical protein
MSKALDEIRIIEIIESIEFRSQSCTRSKRSMGYAEAFLSRDMIVLS